MKKTAIWNVYFLTLWNNACYSDEELLISLKLLFINFLFFILFEAENTKSRLMHAFLEAKELKRVKYFFLIFLLLPLKLHNVVPDNVINRFL